MIICVPFEKVAPKGCEESEEETTYQFSYIEGSLVAKECTGCGNLLTYQYDFQYDDSQVIENYTLKGGDVLGFAMKGCLGEYADQRAGDDVYLYEDEDGGQVLVSQHGCEYPIEVEAVDCESLPEQATIVLIGCAESVLSKLGGEEGQVVMFNSGSTVSAADLPVYDPCDELPSVVSLVLTGCDEGTFSQLDGANGQVPMFNDDGTVTAQDLPDLDPCSEVLPTVTSLVVTGCADGVFSQIDGNTGQVLTFNSDATVSAQDLPEYDPCAEFALTFSLTMLGCEDGVWSGLSGSQNDLVTFNDDGTVSPQSLADINVYQEDFPGIARQDLTNKLITINHNQNAWPILTECFVLLASGEYLQIPGWSTSGGGVFYNWGSENFLTGQNNTLNTYYISVRYLPGLDPPDPTTVRVRLTFP